MSSPAFDPVYEYKGYKVVVDGNANWSVIAPDGLHVADISISPFAPAGWGVKWLISDLAGNDYEGMGGPIDRHAQYVAESHIKLTGNTQ